MMKLERIKPIIRLSYWFLVLLGLTWGCTSDPEAKRNSTKESYKAPSHSEVLASKDFSVKIIPTPTKRSRRFFFESEDQKKLSKKGKKILNESLEKAKDQFAAVVNNPDNFKIVVVAGASVPEWKIWNRSLASDRAQEIVKTILLKYPELDSSHIEVEIIPVEQQDRDHAYPYERSAYFKIMERDPICLQESSCGKSIGEPTRPTRFSFKSGATENFWEEDNSYWETKATLKIIGKEDSLYFPLEDSCSYQVASGDYRSSVSIVTENEIFLDAFWEWNEFLQPRKIILLADYSLGDNGQLELGIHTRSGYYHFRKDIKMWVSYAILEDNTLLMHLSLIKFHFDN